MQGELDRTPVDELSAARSRRRSRIPAWVGGAAAAAVLLVVGTQVLPDLGGGDSDDAGGAESADVAGDGGGEDGGGDAAASAEAFEGDAEEAAPAGPVLAASGRALDGEDVATLTDEAPRLDDVLRQPVLAPQQAFTDPSSLTARDGGAAADGTGPAEDTDDAGTEETSEEMAEEEGDDGARESVADAAQADARQVVVDTYGDDGPAVLRCLDSVADDDVLLLADLVDVDDQPAVVAVFAEVEDGVATGRRLTWALALETCDVLRYAPDG